VARRARGRRGGRPDARQADSLLALGRRLAQRLGDVDGIVAVAAGGSVAAGTADSASDLDLAILYRERDVFDLEALRRLAAEVDDRGAVELTEPGGWGPRINGGGWLVVGGMRVDWLYREVEAYRRAIEEVRRGVSPLEYQAGHPFGWQPQIYAGEVAYGIALHDPEAMFASLRDGALRYPDALRDAKRQELWEARFTLEIGVKAAQRGDVAYLAGCGWRVAMLIVQAIFAANGRYLVNEKGAVRSLERFAAAPPDVASRLEESVARLAGSTPRVRAALGELSRLVDETERLLSDGERAVSAQ
jgi:hypothetical protein